MSDESDEACIDIFNDFYESDLEGSTPSLINAWEIGKKLTDNKE